MDSSSTVKRGLSGEAWVEASRSCSSSRNSASRPNLDVRVGGTAGLLMPALPGEMEDAAELALVVGMPPYPELGLRRRPGRSNVLWISLVAGLSLVALAPDVSSFV